MAEHTLYGFGESGHSYKAALMLELTGLDWRLEPVDYFNGQTREEAYRTSLNEMGEAPVLVHRGLTLTQSGVILDYLSGLTGRFTPRGEEERREVLRWMFFDNHKFSSYYATLRFLVGLQRSGESPVTDWLRGRARQAFSIVDRHLAAQPWLVGERPTIADLSLAGYMFYDEPTGLDLASFRHLDAWRGRLRELPGWRPPYELMPPALTPAATPAA